jgi:hypothetical protein
MNENSRIFDCVEHQLSRFAKQDMFAAKENGAWKTWKGFMMKIKINCRKFVFRRFLKY